MNYHFVKLCVQVRLTWNLEFNDSMLCPSVHKQIPGCTVVGLCPTSCTIACCCCHSANFYIVMSQDVVTVAVVLEIHACVGRDLHLSFVACYSHWSKHWHICALVNNSNYLAMVSYKSGTMAAFEAQSRHYVAWTLIWIFMRCDFVSLS